MMKQGRDTWVDRGIGKEGLMKVRMKEKMLEGEIDE